MMLMKRGGSQNTTEMLNTTQVNLQIYDSIRTLYVPSLGPSLLYVSKKTRN